MKAIHEASQLPQLDTYELPTAHFVRLENHIVWVRYKALDDEVTIEQARKHTEAINLLGGGQPMHVIIDFRDIALTFSNEARAYFASDEQHSALRLSQALILDSLAQRIVGNFYLKFNRPNCPARIFARPEEAVKWIRSLK